MDSRLEGLRRGWEEYLKEQRSLRARAGAARDLLNDVIANLDEEIRFYEARLQELTDGLVHIDQEGAILFPSPEARRVDDRFLDASITDAAFQILQERQEPLHVKELWREMQRGGKRLRAKRPTVSIAAALLRDERFERVGPNTFSIVGGFQTRLPGTD